MLTGAGGDWEPACPQGQLVLRPDGLWSLTVVYAHPGGPNTFCYDPRTTFVTSTSQGTIWSPTGSFQSELGCAADWDPTCLTAWLQDPDGDGVLVHRTDQVPAGTYEVKATRDSAWGGELPAGANVTFTVPEAGDVVRFTLDPATGALGVSIEQPLVVPDLSARRASWTAPGTIVLDVPDGDRRGWTDLPPAQRTGRLAGAGPGDRRRHLHRADHRAR